ncbi:MAG: SpoIIE family protein phosphatase [Bdellovibrionota bacterium]
MFKTFSIRYKILLLLTVVSFVSGSILLYISVDTFKKDKIAYIFENNSNIVSQFSEQISREIQSVNQTLALYMDRFSKTGLLSENTSDEIPNSSLLAGVQIFKLDPKLDVANDYSQVTAIKKTNAKPIDASDSQLKMAIERLSKSKLDFFYTGNMLFFLQKFNISEINYVVVYFYSSETLNDFFSSDSSFKSFLINSAGEVFLKNPSISEDFLTTNFSNYFGSKQPEDNLSTSKIKSDGGESWLLTSTQIPLKDLKLVLLVNEKDALSVLNEMVLKSVLIFIILFASVIIVGIISANYLTSRLSLLSDHTRKVTEGNFSTLIEPKGNDEVTELAQYFNTMTKELKRLMSETANKARMEAELKTAQTVQETLFPESEYGSDNVKVSGHYQPASECGGDWWSYTENHEAIYFWIADATGHGVSAALLTSAAKSSATIIEDMGLEPVDNVRMLNKSICSVANKKIMMTCFHAIYDKKTRILTYVNASHEPTIIFKNNIDNYTKADMIFLNENNNNRLGHSVDTEYTSNEYQLNEGDRLYFYTDGIPDIAGRTGTSLGERGHFKTLLQALNEKTDLSTLNQNFTDSLEKFREKTELVDDVTFFFVEIL